jgi:hypothetical protein
MYKDLEKVEIFKNKVIMYMLWATNGYFNIDLSQTIEEVC